MRKLTLESQKTGKELAELAKAKLPDYFKRMTKNQLRILEKPQNYTGIAARKTEEVCGYWRKQVLK